MKYDIDYSSLPDYMQSGVRDYIEHGYEPGGFLTAVICNDLCGAVDHADSTNQRELANWVRFFYNRTPYSCWGSREKMEAWMQERRAEDAATRRFLEQCGEPTK